MQSKEIILFKKDMSCLQSEKQIPNDFCLAGKKEFLSS